MKLRAVALFIETIGAVDPVVLVDTPEGLLADHSAEGDLLPFKGRHVDINPIADGVFGELQRQFALEFASGVQLDDLHPGLVADRDIEVMPHYPEVDLLLGMGHSASNDQ